MAFQKNPEIEAALERVISAFGHRERGSFIPWAEFDEMTGMDHRVHPGSAVYSKFITWMRVNKSILPQTKYGAGIELLIEQRRAAEVLPKRLRRSRRQVNRGIRDTNGVDTGHLSVHERQVFAQLRFDAARNRLTLGRAYREAKNAVKPTETHPKRKAG